MMKITLKLLFSVALISSSFGYGMNNQENDPDAEEFVRRNISREDMERLVYNLKEAELSHLHAKSHTAYLENLLLQKKMNSGTFMGAIEEGGRQALAELAKTYLASLGIYAATQTINIVQPFFTNELDRLKNDQKELFNTLNLLQKEEKNIKNFKSGKHVSQDTDSEHYLKILSAMIQSGEEKYMEVVLDTLKTGNFSQLNTYLASRATKISQTSSPEELDAGEKILCDAILEQCSEYQKVLRRKIIANSKAITEAAMKQATASKSQFASTLEKHRGTAGVVVGAALGGTAVYVALKSLATQVAIQPR